MHKVQEQPKKQPEGGCFFYKSLSKEGSCVDLLIAAEAGGHGKDFLCQFCAQELVGDLVGLLGQVDENMKMQP